MRSLVEALRLNSSTADIRTGTAITSVTKRNGAYELAADSGPLRCDAVLLAVPARSAAKALTDLAPNTASELLAFQHASAASIGLVYGSGSLRFPAGSSGFLVPSGSGRLLNAGTWWSLKWPDAAGGNDVVRCFVGRSGRHPAMDLDDDELARRAAEEIGELLGTSARPRATRVDRWEDGLPQYRVGHGMAMERIERDLAAHPGIEIAGADYRGTGIPDCVRQGTESARRIIRYLKERPQVESPSGDDPERRTT
jgi:oxygen-dependent protoporphyrinogen oxidase